MSDETKAALEDALRAHVADESDYPLTTDWYIIAASVGEDPWLTDYVHVCSDTPLHSLMGLVSIAKRRLVNDHDAPADEDDD